MHDVPNDALLTSAFGALPMSDVLRLEGVANRDSLPYAETYALGRVEELRTLVRGTIRCASRSRSYTCARIY